MSSESEHGRCVSCGFLATHGDRWHEVTEIERKSGDVVKQDGMRAWTRLVCYVSAADLQVELGPGDPSAAKVLFVIGKDRQCPEWFRYTPDFSAKEHLEKRQMLELEAARQRHDLDLEKQRTEFAKTMAELDTKANERLAKLTNQVTLRIGLAAIIVTVIIGGVQIWVATHPAAPSPAPAASTTASP